MTPEVRQCLDALSRGELSIEAAEPPLARALARGDLNRLELAKAVEELRAAGHIGGREALALLANVDRMTLVRPAQTANVANTAADTLVKPAADAGSATLTKTFGSVPDSDAQTRSFGSSPGNAESTQTFADASYDEQTHPYPPIDGADEQTHSYPPIAAEEQTHSFPPIAATEEQTHSYPPIDNSATQTKSFAPAASSDALTRSFLSAPRSLEQTHSYPPPATLAEETHSYPPIDNSATQTKALRDAASPDAQTKSFAPSRGASTQAPLDAPLPGIDTLLNSNRVLLDANADPMGASTTAKAIAQADSPYPSSSTLVIADDSPTRGRDAARIPDDFDSPPTATRQIPPPKVERTEVIPPPVFERVETSPPRGGSDAKAAAPKSAAKSAAASSAPKPARPKPPDEARSDAITLRDRYRLEKLIGQGAMGQVWKAKDLLSVEARDRNPFVAIKVLREDFARVPHALVGLHREASRAQKLAHPNVGTVYMLDRDEASGRAFIAMEMLEGSPLDKVIKQRTGEPMSRLEGMPIVRGMAEGLAYAHRRGIIHCDFKPANVFLTQDGVPKILDFGIARAVQVAGASGAKLTTEHNDSVFEGYTPTYASPEMIADQEPVPADDVFSIGLVAYELLAGKHPFERKQADVAMKAGMVPAPISGLKRHEWRAIQKALAFERAQRWVDGAAFLKELQGRTPLQKTLLAALAAAVVAAGVFGWQAWADTQPAVPFSSLSPAVQAQFRDRITQGEQSLAYVAKTGDVSASADAAQFFAEAYEMHPKNREAVRGLKQAADYAVGWFKKREDRAEARAELEKFRDKSEFYTKYAPINDAIEDLK